MWYGKLANPHEHRLVADLTQPQMVERLGGDIAVASDLVRAALPRRAAEIVRQGSDHVVRKVADVHRYPPTPVTTVTPTVKPTEMSNTL